MTKAFSNEESQKLSPHCPHGELFHISNFQANYMLYWWFPFGDESQPIAYLLSGSEHIRWILTLKVKCTHFGFCEQDDHQHCKNNFLLWSRTRWAMFFGTGMIILFWDGPRVVDYGPQPCPPKACRGTLTSPMKYMGMPLRGSWKQCMLPFW